MSLKNLIPWRNKSSQSLPSTGAFQLPVDRIWREMDSVFDRFFSDPWGAMPDMRSLSTTGAWEPNIDVEETGEAITVRADLPGMDAKDLDISVTGNVLTLSGQKNEETEHKEKNFHRVERRFGSFRRSIPLPVEVELDKVSAEYAKGVLTIQLPKTEKEVPKRIDVKAAEG